MPGGVSLHMRLAGVRLERPSLRRAVVEKALWRHLSAIGAETDDVTWVADVEAGFAHVRERLQAGHRVWSPSSSGSWLRFSVWDPDAPVSYPDRDLPRRDDPVGAPIVRVARASLGRRWRVHRTSRTYRRWRESYASVPDPVSVYRLALAAADEQAIVLSGRPALDAFAEPDADDFWAEVRADSRWREAVRTYESARMRAPVLEPLVTAFRAGLAFFWLVESANWRQRRCIAVPRPAIHLQNGRLDRADGPAVEWPNGTSYWFWEGLHIPRRAAAQASERARLQVLVRTANLEKRRLLLDRIGYERFLDIADATLHQQDDYGKLWRTTLPVDGEPLTVVEVVNATPEPDGTRRRYFLRVPPQTRTAREAVAWTFDFSDATDYFPAIET
jgi:Domain of unknown function (DUF6745)